MFKFEDGILKKGAYVVIDGVEHEVHMPEYEGKTPMTAENLNRTAKDVEKKINEIEGCHVLEESQGGKYVKLFTATMTAYYKSFNVLFYLNDTQNTGLSQLCNLRIHRANDTMWVDAFKIVPFQKTIENKSSLVAVITDKYTVEVYWKMTNAQSPTVQVLSSTRLREEDVYGRMEFDMSTIVSNLPSGTAITASDRDVLFEGKLYSRQSIALNMKDYSYLLITYTIFPFADDHNSGLNNVMLMDLTTKADNRNVYTCANSVPYNIFASDYSGVTQQMGIGCTVDNNKSNLKMIMAYGNNIIESNNPNYYVCKIVGIL